MQKITVRRALVVNEVELEVEHHRDKPGGSLDPPLPVALRDLQKDRNI